MKESGGGATLIKVVPPGPDPPKVSPLQYRKRFLQEILHLQKLINNWVMWIKNMEANYH